MKTFIQNEVKMYKKENEFWIDHVDKIEENLVRAYNRKFFRYEIADFCKLSKSTINNWRSGKNPVDVDSQKKLIDALERARKLA